MSLVENELATLRARVTELLQFNNEFENRARIAERKFRLLRTARPIAEWSDEDGCALWWKFPIVEPPYVGTPNDLGREIVIETQVMTLRGGDPIATVVVQPYRGSSGQRLNVGGWPGYHTHWTPLHPIANEVKPR